MLIVVNELVGPSLGTRFLGFFLEVLDEWRDFFEDELWLPEEDIDRLFLV